MACIAVRCRPSFAQAYLLAHPGAIAGTHFSPGRAFLRGRDLEWQGVSSWPKKSPVIHTVRPATTMAGGDGPELAGKTCIPCENKSIQPLSPELAQALLKQVPGWELLQKEDGHLRLHREYKVRSFTKGLELFSRVASLAESQGHHPDLHLTGWNNVSLDLWTHSIGGLHENDFIMAAKISALDLEDLVKRKQTKKA